MPPRALNFLNTIISNLKLPACTRSPKGAMSKLELIMATASGGYIHDSRIEHPTVGSITCLAVCCSMLQCVAVCCSVLQCVAVCCSVLQYVAVAVCCSMLQCVAVCCSVLQYVAVCCSVLQYVAVCCSEKLELIMTTTYGRIVHYNVGSITCVAVCCSAVQCCSDWPWVAVYCGMLQ